MCFATAWKPVNKDIQGGTRVICKRRFACPLFKAGWLRKTSMPVAMLKHISPFSEFLFSGCSVMEKE